MIGIIPCAGSATRIHGLPKYLLPVGESYLLKILIERMLLVNLDSVAIGRNAHNLELLTPTAINYSNVYTYLPDRYDTMAETALYGRPLSKFDNVFFGMPDTYFEDDQAFVKLAAALDNGADVAVGLFYARPDQHTKAGMCARKGNQVVEVVDKTERTDLKWLWGCLAWKPAFWELLKPEDPHVGYGLPRAIAAGMDVRAVRMDGQYFDCGTSTEYYELINHMHRRPENDLPDIRLETM